MADPHTMTCNGSSDNLCRGASCEAHAFFAARRLLLSRWADLVASGIDCSSLEDELSGTCTALRSLRDLGRAA